MEIIMTLLQTYRVAKAKGLFISVHMNGAGTEKQMVISAVKHSHPLLIINRSNEVVYGRESHM